MRTASSDDTTGQKLLPYRVDKLEAGIDEIRDAIKSIDRSLQAFAIVQTQYAAMRISMKKAWSDIDKVSARLQALELEMPAARLVQKWVIGGVLGVVGSVGAAVVALVLR